MKTLNSRRSILCRVAFSILLVERPGWDEREEKWLSFARKHTDILFLSRSRSLSMCTSCFLRFSLSWDTEEASSYADTHAREEQQRNFRRRHRSSIIILTLIHGNHLSTMLAIDYLAHRRRRRRRHHHRQELQTHRPRSTLLTGGNVISLESQMHGALRETKRRICPASAEEFLTRSTFIDAIES